MVGSNSKRLLPALSLILACNVPEPPAPTGGVSLPSGPCGRGVVAIASDYVSSNVSLLSFEGEVHSASLISSGTGGPGVSMTLSGDLVAPTETPRSGRVVLIDRSPSAAITWLSPETGLVTAQLSVATGYDANPHDYIEVSDDRAYISRYNPNSTPGREPFDEGNDLVIVDTASPSVLGRIPLGMPDDDELLPRPDRMIHVGGYVVVVLQRFDRDFQRGGDGRLVGIDPATDSIAWVLDLPGLVNCGGLALSPSGRALVVSCAGAFFNSGTSFDQSGVVNLDVTSTPPVEIARYDIAANLGGAPSPAVAFATEDLVLGATFGDLETGVPDRAYSLSTSTGEVIEVHRSAGAFVLGDVRCAASCEKPCFLADAESISLLRFVRSDQDTLASGNVVEMDLGIGLPPRALGGF